MIKSKSNNNPFPFKLKLVDYIGTSCSVCFWDKGCKGCEIECVDEPLYCVSNEGTIAIDWDEDVELNFNIIDSTYLNSKLLLNTDLTVSDCLKVYYKIFFLLGIYRRSTIR